MTRRALAYAALGLILLAAAIVVLGGYATPESLLARRDALQALVVAHPVLALPAFMIAYVVVTSLSVPVAAVLSVLGGVLFGPVLGTVAVLVSATIGATIVFLVARSSLGASLRERAGPTYGRIAGNMRANAVGYLLFLRLIPLFPFFLVNVVASLFEMRVTTYALTTLVGMIPVTLVFVSVGRELGSAMSARDLLSPTTFAALTGLGLLALAPVLYRTWSGRHV